ncbi:MAG: DUF4388 domain-containing protein [Myxococcota bacterium]
MAVWEVLRSLSRAAEEQPDNPEVWLRLAEALLDNGSVDAARHMLVRARSCQPEATDQWRRLGDLGRRLRAQSEIPSAMVLPGDAARETPPPREPPPRGHSRPPPEDISLRGDLAHFTLPDILEFLASQRSTGTLHIHADGRGGAVRMIRGRVVDVVHPRRPTLLSSINATKRLSAAELCQIPQDALTDEYALRKALVELGVLDADVLGRIVWQRIEAGLQVLLRWTEGRAEFHVVRDASDGEPDGIDTQFLLLSALKAVDEAGRPRAGLS